MRTLKMMPFFISYLWFSNLYANEFLTAPHLREVLDKVTEQPIYFREQGRVFGYYSTDSCLFGNQDVLVLKNYCYPKNNYPARSYTILSPELGVIHLYEEKLGSQLKRDIVIQIFSELFRTVITGSIENFMIKDINKILQYFYYRRDPVCWVTNATYEEWQPQAMCINTDIGLFPEWAQSSMQIVMDAAAWDKSLERLIQVTFK